MRLNGKHQAVRHDLQLTSLAPLRAWPAFSLFLLSPCTAGRVPAGLLSTDWFCSQLYHVYAAEQERDKLTVAAEGATRMRIKNQEVIDKEEQIRSLLAANRTKIDNLLATQGKGKCRPTWVLDKT